MIYDKNVLNNPIMDSKKWRFIFAVCTLGFGIFTFLLALKLSPWFYAVNARVRLYLEAPAETKILMCWDKSQIQCLPLVPYSEANHKIAEPEESASVWMSELPPRSSYSITLILKGSLKDALFRNLEIDSSNILLFGNIKDAGMSNLRFGVDQFNLHGISAIKTNGSHYFTSTTGGQLALNREIDPGPPDVFKHEKTLIVWGLLFSIYLLIAIPIFLWPSVMRNLGSRLQTGHSSKYSWWLYIFCGVAILIMLRLVVNSGALLNEYDPFNYLSLALNGKLFSDTRLPGYPLFLNLSLRIFHYNLEGVIIAQSSVLAFSVIACMVSLRKWIPPFAAALFVLLSVLSPAQIHWARWILRESLFTSLILLGITAAIVHFTSSTPLSKIWLYIFAVICGYVFLVRENGVLLSVVLLPVLVPEVIKRLFASGTIWERLRSIFSFSIPYSIPIVTVGALYIIFCTYNYLHYGYFQIGIHQTSHSFLAKAIYPGNSDSRSLLDPGSSVNEEAKSYHGSHLYRSFILARDQTPKLDPVYMALYPSIMQQMSERGYPPNTFHLASILNETGRGMNALVPRKAELSGLLREYAEIISLRNIGLYPLQGGNPYATAPQQELLSQLPIRLKLEERPVKPNSILINYYKVTQQYSWYRLLFVLAFLSSIYLLKHEDAVFLAPITFFVANCVFLIVTRLVTYRYLVNLDVLLILQITLGLSSWINKKYYIKQTPNQT